MVASQTFEERIVAIPLALTDDSTATKIMCINSTNKLRYKTLLPQIGTTTYTGTFDAQTGSQTITLTLPTGIIFENIINIDFKSFHNTSGNIFNNGICWAPDDGTTVGFGAGSATNPSASTTFKIFRKTSRMASAPYKIILMYVAL